MEGGSFLKQRVNSFLGIAIIALMCFWTCMYYFVHAAEAFGSSYDAKIAVAADGGYATSTHRR